MIAPRNERDIMPGLREQRAEVAADGSRAHDCNAHFVLPLWSERCSGWHKSGTAELHRREAAVPS